MHREPLTKVNAKRRDERWTDAHQSMIADRKEAFIKDGLAPAQAERKAKHMQEAVTNQARSESEGR